MRFARPLLVLAAALLLLPAPARAWPARVLSVHDGDSFRVERLDAPKGAKPVNIRVYGIDCPELEQPHGEAARALTARILTGKTVEITPAQKAKSHRRGWAASSCWTSWSARAWPGWMIAFAGCLSVTSGACTSARPGPPGAASRPTPPPCRRGHGGG